MFHPAVAQVTGQPAMPGEPCQTAPLEKWTPQEKWVWRKVCRGEIADFNNEEQRYLYVWIGGDLDPNEREDWPESRVLTPEFLETILLHEPFRSAQTRLGVRIVGAWFKSKIDLEGAEIERELSLDRSRLDKGGSLDDVRAGSLSLRGSVVCGPLSMVRAETGALFMGGAKFQEEVDLRWAKVGKVIDMRGSTFAGTLNMDSATVEEDLFMSATVGEDLFMGEGAKFQEVKLIAAKIGGQLDMSDSAFTGTLDMYSATVGGDLLLRGADLNKAELRGERLSVGGNVDLTTAKVSTIDLSGAKIGNQLDMSDSTFAGTLNMKGVTVEGDLLLHDGAKFQEVKLGGAKIGGQLSMTGSTFAGTLNMNSVTVEGNLFMRKDAMGKAAEFKKVNLRGAKIGGQFDTNGSTFAATLDMAGVTVGDHLYMHKGANYQEVLLVGAKIGGQLSMNGSTFNRILDMNGATVVGALLMHEEAKFQEVSLLGANIGNQLTTDGSTFTGPLSMNGVTVGGNLFMRKDAAFQDVDLRGAKIAGQLDMRDSTFAGTLDMRSAKVGGRLVLHGADLTQARLDGQRLSVGGDLDLSSAKVKRINLPEVTVVGKLWLIEPVWEHGSILDLRDAKVGRLAARIGKSSPVSTMLGGFIYDALGSIESQTEVSNPVEDAADFVERWLREEVVHSPQAHEQFAAVLRQMGFADRASRTLYEGKNHELWEALRCRHLLEAGSLFVLWEARHWYHRLQAGWLFVLREAWRYGHLHPAGWLFVLWESLRCSHLLQAGWLFVLWEARHCCHPLQAGWLFVLLEGRRCCHPLQAGWLFVLWAMIGYGYRVWHALVWIAALVAVGWLIARKSGRKVPGTGQPLGFWYSIDRLLPIMVLRKLHYEVDLPTRSRVYFYFHMVMGYVLATFLLAGLSGLVG